MTDHTQSFKNFFANQANPQANTANNQANTASTDYSTQADNAGEEDLSDVPAIFATIHTQSPERPNGYTDEEIAEMNELANKNKNFNK